MVISLAEESVEVRRKTLVAFTQCQNLFIKYHVDKTISGTEYFRCSLLCVLVLCVCTVSFKFILFAFSASFPFLTDLFLAIENCFRPTAGCLLL